MTTMMHEMTYAAVVAKADSIKAVMGEEPTIYLRDPSPPYGKACDFEAGSTIRLGMSTSGWFTAVVKGIRCRWSFDLESWGANGTGHLQPRIDECKSVLAKLDGTAKRQFREWLVEVATKVRTDAAELRGHADDQAAKAAILADIASQ